MKTKYDRDYPLSPAAFARFIDEQRRLFFTCKKTKGTIHKLSHCKWSLKHWHDEKRNASTKDWREVCQGHIDRWHVYLDLHYPKWRTGWVPA